MDIQLLSIEETARILKVKKHTAYRLAREGIMPIVRLGPRKMMVDEARLREWIANGGAASACNSIAN